MTTLQATRVTQQPDANEQLLYYTAPGLMADESALVFISDRTGHPNLFARDLQSGEERQLSHNENGHLKAYQYFEGRPYEGFGRPSPTFHDRTGDVYYIEGRQIVATNVQGNERWRVEYPADQMTAYTHVSADGARLCVPTTDARALDGDKQLTGKPDYNIDQRVREENLNSYLRIYDTRDGALIHVEVVPRSWITHVYYSPHVDEPHLMHYAYEWPQDPGVRMLWLYDGKTHRPMRDDAEGRGREDWVCHPAWHRDGDAIVYHGRYAKDDVHFVGRIDRDGTITEAPIPEAPKRYGHFTCGPGDWLVTDGYYETPNDPPQPRHGQWICLVRVDWQARKTHWTPLLRHDTSWRNQDFHPHPIFNARGDRVYFNSDVDGSLAVYSVDVDPV